MTTVEMSPPAVVAAAAAGLFTSPTLKARALLSNELTGAVLALAGWGPMEWTQFQQGRDGVPHRTIQ